MDFAQAARRVHLNRSIAFFGAGFCREAVNLLDQAMASTDELAASLSAAAGETEALPLSLAAQQYVTTNSSPDIRILLKQTFSAKKIQAYQEHLACLPWRRVYTTNYDNCLEEGRRARGLSVSSTTSLDSPKDYSGFFSVIHLHGFVERLTEKDWDHAHVLTDTQYSADTLRGSGWLEAFRNDASYADAIFFFGYSMRDIDIARLMYENPSIAEKTFIIIGEEGNRATEVGVQSYGHPVKRNVGDIALEFPVATDPSVPKPSPYLVTFDRMNVGLADVAPKRQDVVDNLIKGDVDSRFVGRDLANDTHEYYVSRDAVNSRAELMGARPERVVIHSNLGNGKTNALLEIAHYLTTSGWSVLWFKGVLDGFELDIDYLASLGSEEQSKTALVFENAFAVAPQIRDILERFPLVSVFLSARTPVLQTRIGSLEETFGEDFELIDLNGISDAEANDFDDILFANGLWGSRQGRTETERFRHITASCKRDLATLLVDVCKSSDIFERIKRQLSELSDEALEIRKAVVAALCLSYAGTRLTISQICEVVQSDLFKLGRYQRDPIILEFMDFEQNRVTARSAAFAKAVLKDAVADHLIIDLIPDLIVRLDQLRDRVPAYSEAVKQLQRFGYIEQILSENDKEEKLVAFFEAVRGSGVGLNNPQFWLQYAIACASFGDYKNASSNFDTALSLAKRRGGYDPYQIENQYAKFLLESRSRSQDWDDYFDAISEAHDIVSRQMNNFTEGYYPYRVARLYLEFVETNHSYITKDQLLRISGWSEQLLVLSARASDQIKRTPYWRQAVQALRHTKDMITELT